MKYCFLLCILGLADATPVNLNQQVIREGLMSEDVSVRNSALENLILGLLEDLRETMLNGANGVPVLDPLNVETINIGDNILPFPGAYANINGLTVSKLSSFIVDQLSVNSVSIILQRYRIDFDLYVPDLEIEADAYELAVSAMGVNLAGKGDAKINLIQPRLIGSLVVAPRISITSGLYLNILQCEVGLRLADIDPRINGLLSDDDNMANFINLFLKYLILDAVVMYERSITEFLSSTVLEVGNDILSDLNILDLIG